MARNPFQNVSDDEEDNALPADKAGPSDEANPSEEGASGNEATPRRRSRGTTGQMASKPSLKERHESHKQNLLGPDTNGSRPESAKLGNGKRRRNAQTVGGDTDEEEEGEGQEGEGEEGGGEEGENGSGKEEGGEEGASDSFIVDDNEDDVVSLDSQDQAEVDQFFELIRSRNPGDVEDYFPQYLRHNLLDILERGDEGSEEEDDAEDDDRCHRKEICSKVEQYLADLRDKCVASEAWKGSLGGFITALTTRPYAKIWPLEGKYGCGACNRKKTHAYKSISFYGPEYQPDWVNDMQLEEAEDQGRDRAIWLQDLREDEVVFEEERMLVRQEVAEDKGNGGDKSTPKPLKTSFAIGSWCAARVRLYHRCLHYRTQLRDHLRDRIEREDLETLACSSTDLASTVADRILGDQGFVDELLEEYKQLKDLCLEYLEKIYTLGQAGLIGFGNKIHGALDNSSANQVLITRWVGSHTAGSPATPLRRRITVGTEQSGEQEEDSDDDMPIAARPHLNKRSLEVEGSTGATAKKRRRTVQRKLNFHTQTPGVVSSPLAGPLRMLQSHTAASDSSQEENDPPPASQPPCLDLVSTQEAAAAPASSQDLAADSCVVDCATHLVMCLGADLARYVKLHMLRKLEQEFCGIDTPDPIRRRREDELRQLCIDLLAKLRDKLGCTELAPTLETPMLESASDVYMRLLTAAKVCPRNVSACAALIADLRRRLGD